MCCCPVQTLGNFCWLFWWAGGQTEKQGWQARPIDEIRLDGSKSKGEVRGARVNSREAAKWTIALFFRDAVGDLLIMLRLNGSLRKGASLLLLVCLLALLVTPAGKHTFAHAH